MSKRKTYLAGDMLKKGSQLLRSLERDRLNQLDNIDLYTPQDQKDINDKSKNPTAEAIFKKDTDAILESELIIFDADDNSVGTTTEVGQVWGLNYLLHRLHDIIDSSKEQNSPEEYVYLKVIELLNEVPVKEVHWHNTDIRNVPGAVEEGLRRSFSLNQYLHGCLLDLAGEAKTFDEIIEEISSDANEKNH